MAFERLIATNGKSRIAVKHQGHPTNNNAWQATDFRHWPDIVTLPQYLGRLDVSKVFHFACEQSIPQARVQTHLPSAPLKWENAPPNV